MDQKVQFKEKLAGILALAETKNKRMKMEEVEEYFAQEHLSQEQMMLVYDYLLSQKVVVKGYVKSGGTVSDKEETLMVAYTEDEKAYLEEYEKDIAGVSAVSEGERETLMGQVLQGDAMAKSRLVESYLPVVVEIAKEMRRQEFFIGDLVQEGNVSLMLAIDSLADDADVDALIRQEIRGGIQAFIEEQQELKTQDAKMVERVNRVDEGIKSLSEDMGRKVSVEELALFLDMDEEAILDVLKLTGEDLEEEAEHVDMQGTEE